MPRWAILVALLASICFVSCRSTGKVVLVKVLYSPRASFRDEIASKLQAYSKQHPLTSNGKEIEVHEVAPGGNTFEGVISGTSGFPVMDADIVVLDPQQSNLSAKIRQAIQNGKPACSEQHPCIAFLGPWVAEDHREAAESVFRALTEGN